MKIARWLLCLLLAAPAWGETVETSVIRKPSPVSYGVGFGVPDFLSLRIRRQLGERWFVGSSLGIFPAPIGAFLGPQTVSLSDNYVVSLPPFANPFSISVFVGYRPWLGRSAFVLQVGTLIANVGATIRLVNSSTGQSAEEGTLEGTGVMPCFTFRWTETFWRSERAQWELSLGVTVLANVSLLTSFTGSLPSYLAIVPDSNLAMESGIDTLKQNVTEVFNQAALIPRVLPSIAVTYHW